MKRTLFLLVLLIVSPAAAAPVPKGGKRQLLIVSMRTGSANIFVVNEDGKNETNLTESKATNSYAAWSPDGKKIAFASNRAGVMHIYVMDADGQNVKALTKGPTQCRVPAWSPDGKSIAFCRANAVTGGSNICIVPATGGEPTVLDGDAWDPAFSPDGKKLAFVSYRDNDGFRLYTMDADGKNQTNINKSGNTFGNAYPAWSPDGKAITWAHKDGDEMELFTTDPAGKDVKQLTKRTGWNLYPAYSPDGKKIAFFSQPKGQRGSIQIMDADGSNVKPLVAEEPYVEGGRPMWKP